MTRVATRITTLGEICDAVGGVIQTGPFGSQLHESDYSDEGVPVVMPRDIVAGNISPATVARVDEFHASRLSKHRLLAGDIVYGRRGDIGRQALIRSDQEGWLCGTGCLRISLGSTIVVPEFLHYYLRQDDVIGWIANQAVGATMPNLNTSILRSVPVSLPTLEEQRRIAGILSAYDDLIENCRRRIEILEEMARSLYREWFVHFRYPGYEFVPLVPSPLGPIPKGWTAGTIGELVRSGDVHLQTGPFGTALRASDYVETGIPVINVRNIGFGRIRSEKLEFISEATRDRLASHILQTGDIVFGRKGAVERHAFITSDEAGWFQGSDCIRLRVNGQRVDATLLTYHLRTAEHQRWMMNQCSHGATMASLNQQIIERIELPLPTADVQRHMASVLSAFEDSIRSCVRRILNLVSTRDTLLTKIL